MSGRCVCCNRVLLRTTGTRTLPTGEKIEETFCNVCRNEVNQILRDTEYNKNTKFDGIVEQQMFYGCVTPQKNPVYQEVFMFTKVLLIESVGDTVTITKSVYEIET